MLAGVLVAGLVLSACTTPAPPQDAATPKFGPWGVDLSGMDDTIRPGDDFYDHVLGTWVSSVEFRPDRVCAGIDLDIQDELDAAVTTVVESASAEHAPKGDVSQQIGDLYASFMDQQALDARGITPVKPFLDAIDAAGDRDAMTSVMLSFNRMRASVQDPFPVVLTVDPNDPSRYLPALSQGGLSLGERDYYLKQDPESVALRAQFVDHVARMLQLAGYRDGREQADRLLALETALAQVQWTQERTRDTEATNNIMPRADVEKLGAEAPLGEMFDALGYPKDVDFLVGMPDVVTKTAHLLATEPVESWKSYRRYQVLAAYGNQLSTPISDELFDFYGRKVAGQLERSPRDERGVSLVNGALGDAVGERYVAAHFSEQTKADALDLVANLHRAYEARIAGAEWMSAGTKAEAQAKLAAMVAKVGYPDKWQSYEDLDITADDLFQNVRNMEAWASQESLDRLGKPVDRIEWGLTPQTNNAYYNASFNEFVFTAAILQAPYFDPAADAAANYGAIGATMGHEMSHAFDDQGRKTDAHGVLRDWWAPSDAARYEQQTDQLVAQYNGFEPTPGAHVNGELTLGENIADLAGLRVAYDAYHLSLGGEEAPVIDGLTGDQRFFLAYAASWKQTCRPETERLLLESDSHSPSKYRVNGVVRNMDEWYSAFDVKEGDALYLAPDQRVRIW
jgi:putative endopeptidase